MKTRTRAGLVLAAALVLGACSSSSTTSSPTTTAAPAGSSTTTAGGTTSGSRPAGTTPAAGKPQHVFIINLENKGYDETFGPDSKAPYLSKELTSEGQLLTQYHGIGHNSLPNYLAQISGQAPNPATQGDCPTFVDFAQTGTAELGQAVGQGCLYPASVKTLADQLEAAGKTWKGYMEDLDAAPSERSTTCGQPKVGEVDGTLGARKDDQYAARHNPFVYFRSITDPPRRCDAHVVPLGQLQDDLASADSTPNLVYITPDLCSDGHDTPCIDGRPGGLQSVDDFLQAVVPAITSSPAFQDDGLLIVTFDEAESAGPKGDQSACCNEPTGPNTDKPGIGGPGGGRTGAVVIGGAVEPGSANDTPYNHYALLCSVEELFGLDKLGYAGQPGLTCFGADVYNAKA